MVNYYKSVYGNGEVSLYIRRRVYCARAFYSIDKISINEISLDFNAATRQFIEKKYFTRAFKEDKLVEIVSIIYFMKFRSEDATGGQKINDVKPVELNNVLNSELLRLFDLAEWTKKVSLYSNKNLILKKQPDHVAKRKCLHILKESKFYASQVFDYSVYKSRLVDLPKVGRICVNILGISIFGETNFKTPEINVFMNDLLEFEQKGPKVRLKLMISNEVKTVFLEMKNSRQFCEDVASHIILSLRENRYYYYSYTYIARILPPYLTTKQKIEAEQMHGQKISKCNEHLSNNGDNIASYFDLAFCGKYLEGIKQSSSSNSSFYYPFKKTDLTRDPRIVVRARSKPTMKPINMIRKKETDNGGGDVQESRIGIDETGANIIMNSKLFDLQSRKKY